MVTNKLTCICFIVQCITANESLKQFEFKQIVTDYRSIRVHEWNAPHNSLQL